MKTLEDHDPIIWEQIGEPLPDGTPAYQKRHYAIELTYWNGKQYVDEELIVGLVEKHGCLDTYYSARPVNLVRMPNALRWVCVNDLTSIIRPT